MDTAFTSSKLQGEVGICLEDLRNQMWLLYTLCPVLIPYALCSVRTEEAERSGSHASIKSAILSLTIVYVYKTYAIAAF